MALIDNGKGGLLVGVALGVGVAAATRIVPAIRSAGKPLAKAALKSGWLFLERSRETLAELTEQVEDLLAEVQAEVEAETEARADAAAAPAEDPISEPAAKPAPKKTSKPRKKSVSRKKAE